MESNGARKRWEEKRVAPESLYHEFLSEERVSQQDKSTRRQSLPLHGNGSTTIRAVTASDEATMERDAESAVANHADGGYEGITYSFSPLHDSFGVQCRIWHSDASGQRQEKTLYDLNFTQDKENLTSFRLSHLEMLGHQGDIGGRVHPA